MGPACDRGGGRATRAPPHDLREHSIRARSGGRVAPLRLRKSQLTMQTASLLVVASGQCGAPARPAGCARSSRRRAAVRVAGRAAWHLRAERGPDTPSCLEPRVVAARRAAALRSVLRVPDFRVSVQRRPRPAGGDRLQRSGPDERHLLRGDKPRNAGPVVRRPGRAAFRRAAHGLPRVAADRASSVAVVDARNMGAPDRLDPADGGRTGVGAVAVAGSERRRGDRLRVALRP